MHQMNGPRLQHAQGTTPQGLVVIFHGYGASGDNLISLAHEWHQDFPTLDFIAPNGIEAWEGGIPGGYQWFSLIDRSLKRIEKSLDELRPTIISFLDAELQKRNLAYKDLILVGFSQGAMLALDLGLHGQNPPAGVIAYSGGYISTKDIDQKNVPVLLIHGTDDSVLPPENSHASHVLLKDAGVASQLHILENLDHAIDHRGLRLGEDFIRKTLGALY
ncbi:Putative hydrolase [Candidatus Bealeia paramacronuclearis]|uniref:Hydrolase n=1 Tax=Candidatus Bealeia paramacronuclearis TaxID=1921001 RepID=A0ABZ2C5F1_9PROT|nr:putative hydrolase [Candidatus Bealeia paramacronuclearis]